MISISFLVPIYNKQGTILETIQMITMAAKNCGADFEIIAIDDGSTDQSWEIINSVANNFDFIRTSRNTKNIGFARTYLKAAQLARKKFVMYISADNDIPQESIEILINATRQCDAVIQIPARTEKRTYWRSMLSQFYTYLLNKINLLHVGYYNGLNIYPTSFINSMDLKNKSFAFQAEITRQASRSLTFKQVPVRVFHNDSASNAITVRNIFGVLSYLFFLIGERCFGSSKG